MGAEGAGTGTRKFSFLMDRFYPEYEHTLIALQWGLCRGLPDQQSRNYMWVLGIPHIIMATALIVGVSKKQLITGLHIQVQ